MTTKTVQVSWAHCAVLSMSIALLCMPSGILGQTIEERSLHEAETALARGDTVSALRIFSRLATAGNPEAQYQLARLRMQYSQATISLSEMRELYRRAAEQGHPRAAFEYAGHLGFILRYGSFDPTSSEHVEAVRWYRFSAENGVSQAQFVLGLLYHHGRGVEEDFAEAIKWYRHAADQDHGPAQRELGLAYYYGRVVRQDFAEAALWLWLAAGQGEVDSMHELGRLYERGHGVEQDLVRAHMWYNLAAEREVVQRSAIARGRVSAQMTPTELANAQQLAREWRPRPAGHPPRTPDSPPVQPGTVTASAGTSFFVTAAGHAVTNAHVVQACRQVELVLTSGREKATVLAIDHANDLALLKVSAGPQRVPRFRKSARQGESIAVYGYPLAGLLAVDGNFTTGSVTALTGLEGDDRLIQLSAPVQPGSSGGPVMDQSGHIVGIIVAQLDHSSIREVVPNIPQNVNFAIKAEVALSFLEAHRIAFSVEERGLPLMPELLADWAREFTALVECVR
jgi:uncharacterized protein